MSNIHYDNIFKFFKSNFQSKFDYAEKLFESEYNDKSYVHNYEFGAYREDLVRKFLKAIVPTRFDISQGFLINRNNRTSKQIDLIIYDHQSTPLIQDQINNRFFPAEPVVGIGEVKSKINSKAELKSILRKLASNKFINRDKNPEYIVFRNENRLDQNYKLIYDFPFSFLICKKLNFNIDNLENELNELYENVSISLRHNLILSIEDGYFGYQDPNDDELLTWQPTNNKERNKNAFRSPGVSELAHFRTFAKAINLLSFATSIYIPHLPDYITFDNSADLRFET